MVFFYFGPEPSSWACGNDRFSVANNLPPAIQAVWDQLGEPFQDKQMAGTRIQWMSTSPNGNYAVMTKNGDLLSNVDALLAAVRIQMQTVFGTSVEHVSFSPLGGWFIKYKDGTVQLSGKFPDSFFAIATRYVDITSQNRQRTALQNVFCGKEQAVFVKATGATEWTHIPDAMAMELNRMKSGSYMSSLYVVGNNTVLCPWSYEYYFLEVAPFMGGQIQYSYNLPANIMKTEFLEQMTENLLPAPHLIPQTSRSQTPRSSKPANPPARDSNPFRNGDDAAGTTSPSTVSVSARRRYEEQFDQHSNGRLYISGNEAVGIMLESGLDATTLSGIWELVDLDRNGKLDREEFVQAMWHIDNHRGGTGSELAVRETTNGYLNCDGCSRGLLTGEDVYYCSVCQGGDFDLCSSCYADRGKYCSHQLKKLTVQFYGDPEPRFISADHAVCDGCGTRLEIGDQVFWCEVCNHGDYDICSDCLKSQRTCGHWLGLRELTAAQPTTTFSPYSEPTTSFSGHNFNSGPHLPSKTEPDSEADKTSKKYGDSKLKESLMSSILTEKPNVKWDDVAGLESAKAELQEAIIFPIRFPHMFRGKRQARRALLLYGPPGTGKSYLAKAVATEVDHTLFSISSSDLTSKWLGESEGLMRQLFELAREKKPSIIFIDEIDAICGDRDSGKVSMEDTARMKTEFLVQMDGVGNNNDGVFVLAATNLPWSLDPAVRRRFQKRIHVPLPDEKARHDLFKVHLGDMASMLGDTDSAFRDLAARTEGYSGSDIANLVQDALMIPIKKVHSATHFRKYRDREGEWHTPCAPGTPRALPMKWSQVPARRLKEPPLMMQDLYEAVSKVKPSVGEEEIRKCHEWTQQFGLEGA